jgi:biopolymer transport protein ExbB/TolQ
MDETQMIVALTALGCGTGILCYFMTIVKDALMRRPLKGREELTAELRALKEEVRQLRQQNNDLILNLDTTLQRLDHLPRLENRSSLEAGKSVSQTEEAPAKLEARSR